MSDACGAVWGLPPGHGEAGLAAAIAALPAEATVVYRLAPGLEEAEVEAGIEGAARLVAARVT